MKFFGKFDHIVSGIVVSLIFLVVYGKILSDFAQFYITGHTANFMWIAGDLGQSNHPGSYSLTGFIWIAVLGYANMVIWLRLFKTVGGRVYHILSKYEIRRKDNILVVRSKKGTK